MSGLNAVAYRSRQEDGQGLEVGSVVFDVGALVGVFVPHVLGAALIDWHSSFLLQQSARSKG